MAKQRTKHGGRQKGTPNRVSGDLKSHIGLLLADQFPEFMRRLARLDDETYCKVYLALLPYSVARQKEILATVSGGGGFVALLPDNRRDTDFNPADLDEV